MKFLSLSALSLLLGLSLVSASPLEKKPGSKITRNEAQHLALKAHPDARVTSAKLETIEGKRIWVVGIAQEAQQMVVQVDAVTGRIVSTEKVNPGK